MKDTKDKQDNTTIHLFKDRRGITWQTQYCPYDGMYYGWTIGRNALKAKSLKGLWNKINS